MRSTFLLVAKAAAGLICAAAVWEVIARAGIASIVWLRYEPVLGHVHSAGSTVVTNEGFARSTYDKDGYRGGLPPVRPRMMVLALGDSMTEAAQVPDSDTFCKQASEILKANGVDAFVANAGLAGGCPAKYVAVAPWYLANLHPDRVVVQLDEGDFVSDLPNQTGDFFIKPSAAGFQLEGAPHRVGIFERLDSSKLPPTAKWLVKTFAPTSLLQLGLNAAAGAPQEATTASTPGGKGKYLPYVRWSVQALKQAYKDPILLFLPNIDYFDLKKPEPEEEAALRLECAAEGITLIDMRQTFIENFQSTGQCASGFSNTQPGEGHMNALGHRMVALALVSAIAPIGAK